LYLPNSEPQPWSVESLDTVQQLPRGFLCGQGGRTRLGWTPGSWVRQSLAPDALNLNINIYAAAGLFFRQNHRYMHILRWGAWWLAGAMEGRIQKAHCPITARLRQLGKCYVESGPYRGGRCSRKKKMERIFLIKSRQLGSSNPKGHPDRRYRYMALQSGTNDVWANRRQPGPSHPGWH
jgi:hypothetical protein